MQIVEPKIYVEPFNGKDIMKKIERAMRNCYQSQDKTDEESYKRLLSLALNSGHLSVAEHEKVSVLIQCDIGFYKDITRHRAGTAFSIESTRYCSYNKDKFGNQIKFIKPFFYESTWELAFDEEREMTENEYKSYLWYECMEDIEEKYMTMSQAGCKPDELRMILPHSTAAKVYMTANIREWMHILSLRTKKMTHPSIQQILIPLLLLFKKEMPELFNGIEYNEEIPKEKYAQIEVADLTKIIEI